MSALIMILPIGAMLFFMQRTQKKQQQERQKLMDSITVGSRVITIGGLHGVISEVNSDKNTVVFFFVHTVLDFLPFVVLFSVYRPLKFPLLHGISL